MVNCVSHFTVNCGKNKAVMVQRTEQNAFLYLACPMYLSLNH